MQSAAFRQVAPSDLELTRQTVGTPGLSLDDFAEQFERLFTENRDLAFRLSKALDENVALTQLHKQACAGFESERTRLNSEIANLKLQLNSRLHSVLSTKEKLMKEEFERKLQELTIDLRQERHRYRTAVEDLKKRAESCICRARNR